MEESREHRAKALCLNLNVLTEATYSHIATRLGEGGTFGIISAYRLLLPRKPQDAPESWIPFCDEVQGYPPGNRARTHQMRTDLDTMKIAYYEAFGPWPYGPCLNRETGETMFRIIRERSFIVLDIHKEDLLVLGKKYNQQAVIWGRIGEGVYLLPTDGGAEIPLGRELTTRVGDAYTQLRTKRFSFKDPLPAEQAGSFEVLPQNESEQEQWVNTMEETIKNTVKWSTHKDLWEKLSRLGDGSICIEDIVEDILGKAK